jgi:mono/diheme cytochrome c family protein
MAQEPAVALAQPDKPIYEELGMSSTLLACIMVLFTALLVGFVMSLSTSAKNILEFKRSKIKKPLQVLLLLISTGFTSVSFSATPETAVTPDYQIPFPDEAFWAFLTLDIILVMIIVYQTGLIKGVVSEYKIPRKLNLFSKWNKQMTDAVPVEEEHKILIDHDYDGIRELDNNLPPWWKYGFYITIGWSFFYLIYYNVLNAGPLQEQEYLAEMEAGDKADAAYKEAHPELITAENVTLLTDASSLSAGQSVYVTYCQTCHMENGRGGAGPNLTDKNWIYGGDIKGVFTTITDGAKNGMVAWKELLPADDIQAVASYILSLDYVAPPTGKAPQGDNITE